MSVFYRFLEEAPGPEYPKAVSSPYSTPAPHVPPSSSASNEVPQEGLGHEHTTNIGNGIESPDVPILNEKSLMNMLASLSDTRVGFGSTNTEKEASRQPQTASAASVLCSYDTNDAMNSMINILRENTTGNVAITHQPSVLTNEVGAERKSSLRSSSGESRRAKSQDGSVETPQASGSKEAR